MFLNTAQEWYITVMIKAVHLLQLQYPADYEEQAKHILKATTSTVYIKQDIK